MMSNKNYPPHTRQQQKALHKYCALLAEALNDAGLDARKTLKPEMEIPWTKQMVKDLLVRPIMLAMTGKETTTELNTVEPSEVYAVLDRYLGEKFGIHVEWPSNET